MALTVVAASGGNHALFVLLVLLHAAAALVGFGSIGFAGTYASRGARMAASAEWWSSATLQRQEVGGTSAQVTQGSLSESQAPGAASPPSEVALGPSEEVLAPSAESLEASEEDPEVEELLRYFRQPARFWPAVVAVPVFGLLALWAQPGGRGLNQLWSVTALLVWVAALVVVGGVILPGLRQMSGLLDAYGRSLPVSAPGDPSGPVGTAWRARLGRSGALASRGAAACDVLFFVALSLMIWQQ